MPACGRIRLSEPVRVRALDRSDFSQWKQLWDGYNAFYGRFGETALAPDITRMTWSRFFDAYEPMHALVAEIEGRIVGFTHFLYHRSTIQIARACYLADLFTASDIRGQGVGRALIEAVYAHAKLAGSPRVYWQTHETNSVAMRLTTRWPSDQALWCIDAVCEGVIVARRELHFLGQPTQRRCCFRCDLDVADLRNLSGLVLEMRHGLDFNEPLRSR